MQIAQSATRDQFPLSKKKIIKKTLSRTLFIIILFSFLWLWATITIPTAIGLMGVMTFIIFGLLLVIILLTYFYQRWYFAVYFYDLTPDFIQIKKGPITPREITIPYERIQDVYVDQDLLDRLFGLYDVHLSSATAASGIAAHIDGVEKQAADGLRTALLETVKQRIGKKTTSSAPANNQVS